MGGWKGEGEVGGREEEEHGGIPRRRRMGVWGAGVLWWRGAASLPITLHTHVGPLHAVMKHCV